MSFLPVYNKKESPVISLLIIEDCEDDMVLLERIINRASGLSFSSARAFSLKQGLSMLGETDYDAVILDLTLPDSYGIATFDKLQEAFPAVPVVVLSGIEDENTAVMALKKGAQDYLVKGQADSSLVVRSIRYAVERARIQAALHEQHSLLRSIIDSIPDEVYFKDIEGRFVLLNPATAHCFGVASPEDVIGKTDFDFFPPELANRFKDEEQKIFRNNEPCVNREAAVTTTAGCLRWVITTKVPFFDHNGNRTGLIGINRDVTALKIAEQELRRFNEELERRVLHRTTELREALDRLEQHDRARAAFVSNVSHELKTPLGSMKLAVDNLLRGVGGQLTTQGNNYLRMISEDCRRLIGTVNDILDVSRIEAGKMRLQRAKIPFGWFAEQVVASLTIDADDKKLRLVYSNNASGVFVEGDPEKLYRVILNLVSNAIKFTQEGGGVDITLKINDETARQLKLEVADTGIGIAAEHLPHIGERYYRVGEHISGTGLGLYLSKEIIQQHGGVLFITSPRPGMQCGTVVTVCLPLAAAPEILVFNPLKEGDDVLVAELIKHGFTVNKCCSEDEAYQKAYSSQPYCMLINVSLSGTLCTRLISLLRKERETRHLALIAFSSADVSNETLEMLNDSGVPHLVKDSGCKDLLNCIEEATLGKKIVREIKNEQGKAQDSVG